MSSTSLLDIKLKGNPWGIRGIGDSDITVIRSAWDRDVEGQAIHAQRLICSLLSALHGEGWVLMQSTDISNVLYDADTLLFRHQIPAPAPQQWFSLVFYSQHKLRFVDAPRALCLRVVEHFAAQKMEMKFKEHGKVEGCSEIKFAGQGWSYISYDTMKSRMMFLDLLECLEESGWTLYASVEQNTRGDEKGVTDTWYCCRPVGWVEGNPVYHN
ncbi:hypothetical protein N0V90_005931 [Kalmusia sp. IMI 367209]|nr:hypothetical protein N0V90_005931 [Kalmusia sp. IMI 367209]